MAKSASDLTTAELPVPQSRQRMGGARLGACARAPEPLRPAVPPDPGRGQSSPSYGPAGTAKAAGFHLCWARPQQASGGAEASGGLQQQDGLSLYSGQRWQRRYKNELGAYIFFFFITDLSSVPEIVPTRRRCLSVY